MSDRMSPKVERLEAEADRQGLVALLDSDDVVEALEAAEALAGLDDWRGLSFLLTSLEQADPEVRGAAAELLGELGSPRAIPGLTRMLRDPEEDIRQTAFTALQLIGGPEAQKALDEYLLSEMEVIPPDGWAWPQEKAQARPVGPFPTAEEHLSRADQLEESQVYESALVECDLALALAPEWADAYNLRGILLEDLGRDREAQMAYRKALAIEPDFSEARQNLEDLNGHIGLLVEDYDAVIGDLHDPHVELRQGSAAMLAELGNPEAVDELIDALDDDSHEVVQAAVEALGLMRDKRAVGPLSRLHETSWTMGPEDTISQITHTIPDREQWRLSALEDWRLRITIIRALGRIGETSPLLKVLSDEFDTATRQNVLLRAAGLPGLESEIDQTIEIAAYALAATSDLKAIGEAAKDASGGQVAEIASWVLDQAK